MQSHYTMFLGFSRSWNDRQSLILQIHYIIVAKFQNTVWWTSPFSVCTSYPEKLRKSTVYHSRFPSAGRYYFENHQAVCDKLCRERKEETIPTTKYATGRIPLSIEYFGCRTVETVIREFYLHKRVHHGRWDEAVPLRTNFRAISQWKFLAPEKVMLIVPWKGLDWEE